MSAVIDDGGPAFPCDSAKQFPTHEGMTLRDWFAGQTLIALHASEVRSGDWDGITYRTSAVHAYNIADAMIAARKGGAS